MTELPGYLQSLENHMRDVAEKMQMYGGEIRDHGDELERAALMVREWAKGILRDGNPK